jgi:hypothetical protein
MSEEPLGHVSRRTELERSDAQQAVRTATRRAIATEG